MKLRHLTEVERGSVASGPAGTTSCSRNVREASSCPTFRPGPAGLPPLRRAGRRTGTGSSRTWLRPGIGTGIHYPVPLHLAKPYEGLGFRPGDFPAAEQAAAHVLSLPMFPGLLPEQQQRVAAAVMESVGDARGRGRGSARQASSAWTAGSAWTSSASRPTTTTVRPAWSATARSSRPRRRSASRRKKHDAGFPQQAVRYCLREGGIGVKDLGTSRSTTSRWSSSSGCWRPTSPTRPGASLLPQGDAGVAEGEALPEDLLRKELARRAPGSARASCRRSCSASTTSPTPPRPSIPRRSTRPRCCAWTAWASGRRRQPGSARARSSRRCWEIPLPALARPALLGVHLLHRLQGELRRVQGHGAGALRPAEVRRRRSTSTCSTSSADGTFRLNMEYFNYCAGLTMTSRASTSCSAARRAKPETPADPAGDGSRPLDPGGHRGGHAAPGPARSTGRPGSRTSAWPAASR